MYKEQLRMHNSQCIIGEDGNMSRLDGLIKEHCPDGEK